MAVRPDLPWYWRSARWAAAALAMIAGAWALADLAGVGNVRQSEIERELVRLRLSVERREAELAQMRAGKAAMERQLQIERSAAGDLAKQMKSLTYENAALKEDLAFFQSLMANPSAPEGSISVNRFRLEPESTPGEYRYRMLLVRSGQRGREFEGTLQFVLDVQRDGRKLVLTLPPEGERGTRDYELRFKLFQRIEGSFKLTPGSVLRGMQVRVFETGARSPKLTQMLNIS